MYIKKHIQDVPKLPFKPHSQGIRLDLNEFPFDWDDFLKEEIIKNVKKTYWNRYIDWNSAYSYLTVKLSEQLKCNSNFISLGSGSSYLISQLIGILDFEKRETIVVNPSFPYINYCLSLNDIKYENWDLKNYCYNFEQVEKIKNDAVVFAISPHNPFGIAFKRKDFEPILKEKKNVLFVIDQAYLEFSDDSYNLLELISKYNNLILIRTFSKAFSAAALRFGYIITSSTEITNNLYKVTHPFILNPLTFHFVDYILKNYKLVQNRVRFIVEERERIKAELNENKNLLITDSKANFIFVEVKDGHYFEQIKKNLSDNKMLHYEIGNSFRITIGTQNDNNKIISIFC